jgi:hypothetical protein
VAQLVHGFRTESPTLVELSDSARLRQPEHTFAAD